MSTIETLEKRCEICSKLKIKRHQNTSMVVLVSLLLALNREIFAGKMATNKS